MIDDSTVSKLDGQGLVTNNNTQNTSKVSEWIHYIKRYRFILLISVTVSVELVIL